VAKSPDRLIALQINSGVYDILNIGQNGQLAHAARLVLYLPRIMTVTER
jgi:hypothetical protein